MFCPNCGANNTTEQKFCRSCGLNLEKTAESILEQLPSAQSANLLKREQMLEKFGSFAWSGFGVVIVIAVAALIYTVITKMVLTGDNIFAGIILAAFMLFGTLSVAYVVFNEDLKEKRQKMKPQLKNDLPEKRDTAKLLEEKPFEPASSVTENTTGLLYAEQKTKKFE